MQSIFSWQFAPDQVGEQKADKVMGHIDKIDDVIKNCAPAWPLAQISQIDLSILRLAVYELLIKKTEPPKVIIDEAVELAKEFGSETSSSFVNGVLGSVVKKEEILIGG